MGCIRALGHPILSPTSYITGGKLPYYGTLFNHIPQLRTTGPGPSGI